MYAIAFIAGFCLAILLLRYLYHHGETQIVEAVLGINRTGIIQEVKLNSNDTLTAKPQVRFSDTNLIRGPVVESNAFVISKKEENDIYNPKSIDKDELVQRLRLLAQSQESSLSTKEATPSQSGMESPAPTRQVTFRKNATKSITDAPEVDIRDQSIYTSTSVSEVSTAQLSRTASQPSIMNSEMSSTSHGVQYNENDTADETTDAEPISASSSFEQEHPPLKITELNAKELDPSPPSQSPLQRPTVSFPMKVGWVKIGTKIQLSSKIRWHYRYLQLNNGYLSVFRNEEMKEKDCVGFVPLMGCKILSKSDEGRGTSRNSSIYKIMIKRENDKPIFSRTHPEKGYKVQWKHFLFYMRANTCRIRIKDDKEAAESWLETLHTSIEILSNPLQLIIATTNSDIVTPPSDVKPAACDSRKSIDVTEDEEEDDEKDYEEFKSKTKNNKKKSSKKVDKSASIANVAKQPRDINKSIQNRINQFKLQRKNSFRRSPKPSVDYTAASPSTPAEPAAGTEAGNQLTGAVEGDSVGKNDSTIFTNFTFPFTDTTNKLTKGLKDLMKIDPTVLTSEFIPKNKALLIPKKTSSMELYKSDGEEVETIRDGFMRRLTSKVIGLDAMKLSLPLHFIEPTTFLQRMCEMLGYSDLLDKADECMDEGHRMAYVVAFAISRYSHNTRTTKPLNPVLGETFEYVNREKFRFFAEQVSENPPQSVCYADNDHFMYTHDLAIKTKFSGNSLLCNPSGHHHIKLKKSGDYYTWSNNQTTVQNVLIGPVWVEHTGDLEITNHKNGYKCKIEFKKATWMNRDKYQINGNITDNSNKIIMTLDGKWNESLTVAAISGLPIPENPIWKHEDHRNDDTNTWKLCRFAQELNRIDEFLLATLPKTDSRLRKDRLAMERNQMKIASLEKKEIETKTRNQRKYRVQNAKLWKPTYFEKTESSVVGVTYWKSNGKYWTERTNRIKQLTEKQANGS